MSFSFSRDGCLACARDAASDRLDCRVLGSDGCALFLVPTAGATNFFPTWAGSDVTSAPFTTGTGVNLFTDASPYLTNGTLYFWQNSTVGQVGPSDAYLTVTQGFESGAGSFKTAGSHQVTVTWQVDGWEFLGARCFSNTGAAGMSAKEILSYAVEVGGTSIALSSNTSTAWSYSASSNCPTGSSSGHALTGTLTKTFPIFNIVPGTFHIWAYLSTNTSAAESSVSDVIAQSCIDYAFVSNDCSGHTGGGGYARLTEIQIS